MTPDSSLSPVCSSTARWRWWVALLLMGSCPLLAALSSLLRTTAPDDKGAMLPKSVPGLLLFCALQLGVFGLIWTISWAFSRANRDQLFLRFRGGKSLLWGVLYSVLMRFGLGFLAIAVLIALSLFGFDSEKLLATLKANSDNIKNAFAPAFASRDPLYRVLLITLVSFVVAGLREELWRAATLAGIFHLAPAKWSQNRKNAVALGVSSALFGLGHGYQGVTGVFGTAVLGLILGLIMLRHQSVWPAIVAHGCFDAVSFAALAALGTK